MARKAGRVKTLRDPNILSSSDPHITSKTRKYMRNQPLHRILIPSTETKKDPVDVSVNGWNVRIMRDRWVDVPLAVVEVLNNATEIHFTQERRSDGEGMDLVEHEIMRFPYQSKGIVSEDEDEEEAKEEDKKEGDK